MDDNRNFLVLTTLSCIFFGFIVPMILWFTKKETFEEEDQKYLLHLLNFELTLFIPFIILVVINNIPFVGFIAKICSAILWITNLILIIKALKKLSNDEKPQFPFVYNLLK